MRLPVATLCHWELGTACLFSRLPSRSWPLSRPFDQPSSPTQMSFMIAFVRKKKRRGGMDCNCQHVLASTTITGGGAGGRRHRARGRPHLIRRRKHAIRAADTEPSGYDLIGCHLWLGLVSSVVSAPIIVPATSISLTQPPSSPLVIKMGRFEKLAGTKIAVIGGSSGYVIPRIMVQ